MTSHPHHLALTVGCLVLLLSHPVWGKGIGIEPEGFRGIPWGSSLDHVSQATLIDSGEHINTYILSQAPPRLGSIPVDSIELLTIHDKFARVFIRYKGTETHQFLMRALESQFGQVTRVRGAMVRGLNQEYSWRGQLTLISVTFRGLQEQGFIFVESRLFSPNFLDTLTEHSH